MRRLRFDVAYDGTDFHGWQVQPNLLTIQGVLETVISSIEGQPVNVAGSGRTDAGVHAYAQVAAVTLANPIPPDNFRRAVNRLLPRAIRICNVAEASLDFHPRFDAKRKIYEYRIYRGEICPPILRHFVYHHPYPLNERAMMEAAALLEGEHDFRAFAATDENDGRNRSYVRRIFRSVLTREEVLLTYKVCLLQVGRGNLSKEDVVARFQPDCQARPGHTAPASGLFLISVDYER